jgi:hypothetical protein
MPQDDEALVQTGTVKAIMQADIKAGPAPPGAEKSVNIAACVPSQMPRHPQSSNHDYWTSVGHGCQLKPADALEQRRRRLQQTSE